MSEQTFSTNDLRSASVDTKRRSSQKHKWALGQAWGPGRDQAANCRPMKGPSLQRQAASYEHHACRKSHARALQFTHQHESLADYISGDSSCDSDVEEASAAPAPDAEITYSFDAPTGPTQGSQVLGVALARAVERFEDQRTDKLVRDEYEILDEEGEAVTKGKKGKRPAAVVGDEAEYEFV